MRDVILGVIPHYAKYLVVAHRTDWFILLNLCSPQIDQNYSSTKGDIFSNPFKKPRVVISDLAGLSHTHTYKHSHTEEPKKKKDF